MSEKDARFSQAMKEILAGGFTRTILAVLLGFLVGAVFMIGSNNTGLASRMVWRKQSQAQI